MAVTAQSSKNLSVIFLYFSLACFAIAIVALILGLVSKDSEKFWTGVTAAMIMGLIFLA